jgi:hypothetical protein
VAFWHGVRVEALNPDRDRATPGSWLLARLLGRRT